MHSPSEDIIGWGADAPLANRPGVPREFDPPMPLGNMSLMAPEQQSTGRPSAKSALHPLTPVFGTVVPLRGLSGLIRRFAYTIPDYKARRWLLLMLADRVDVVEHNVVPATMALSVLALGIVGLRALRR
jgi:hypothetical protein